MSVGCTDNGSTTALSSTSYAGPLRLPEQELQKLSGDRLEETLHKNDALSDIKRALYRSVVPMSRVAAAVSGIHGTEQHDCARDIEGALRPTGPACAESPNSATECAELTQIMLTRSAACTTTTAKNIASIR
ncbi:hypothetical protein MTO96_027326 [Rhipicephalus appendiculatus]